MLEIFESWAKQGFKYICGSHMDLSNLEKLLAAKYIWQMSIHVIFNNVISSKQVSDSFIILKT